jgi:ribonuclease BN (tRNA processing enzyme)
MNAGARFALGAAWLAVSAAAHAQTCEPTGVRVQVLGSGGPELHAKRAGSSYLVWIDGKPRALVDLGQGSALRFGEAGASVTEIDVILFTHLHTAHSVDLPALMQSSAFENRSRVLPVYGPAGNKFMPSTVTFVRDLFDSTRGAYRYLGDFINPNVKSTYKLEPRDVREKPPRLGAPRKNGDDPLLPVFANERLRAIATSVTHGQVPALAWRLEAGGKQIVFSGDTNGGGENLAKLARGAHLLVAHYAVPEGASGIERTLHMPPSTIARLAREADVKQLVLSHRSLATLGRESETTELIRQRYAGPVAFANDLDCFTP